MIMGGIDATEQRLIKLDVVELEEWIRCRGCVRLDSRHHWIRKCTVEPYRSTYDQTLGLVKAQIEKIWSGMGGTSPRSLKLRNICHEIIQYAENVRRGEQLWMGIISWDLVDSIQPRMSINPLPVGKMTGPNRWRRTIKNISATLIKDTRTTWKDKEEARRDKLAGERTLWMQEAIIHKTRLQK